MTRTKRIPWGIVILFAVGLFMIRVPLQDTVISHRKDLGHHGDITSIQGPTPVLIAALGGFRTVAADLCWLKVDQLWDGGSWYLLPSVMESAVQLDPHFVLAWQVYGWHLAYNLNAESVSAMDKKYWLEEGVKVLQRGVDANSDVSEMTHELAWTYLDRVHNLPLAAEYFYRAAKLSGARSFDVRLYYRAYEHLLDFKHLWPAMEWARTQFPDDHVHQRLVSRDIEYWKRSVNDPAAHHTIIADENTARQQRGLDFYLYPGDPFWDVCSNCGKANPKGAAVCQYCGQPFPKPQPKAALGAG
jgi:hypothetical protein